MQNDSLTYRERRERKAERLREWAEKRDAKASAAYESADQIASMIPFGQPILVGHHSEGRHRRNVERIDNGMRRSVENSRKAEEMRSRANNIERAAKQAIYSDDADAIERLTEKLATMEAQREAMKARNAEYRKSHKAELKAITSSYMRNRALPHPSYELQNLSGNISRCRARLAQLTA